MRVHMLILFCMDGGGTWPVKGNVTRDENRVINGSCTCCSDTIQGSQFFQGVDLVAPRPPSIGISNQNFYCATRITVVHEREVGMWIVTACLEMIGRTSTSTRPNTQASKSHLFPGKN